jgi:hypothetical protein
MISLIPILIVALFLILVFLTAHWNVASTGTGQTEELRLLRSRIKVLERIVIDQDRQLRRDIDGLS